MTIPPILPRPKEEISNLAMIARDGIRRHCEWLILSSREIDHYLRLLKSQPEWETEAEDALLRAKVAIEEARGRVEVHYQKYKNLPVEKDRGRSRS